MLSLRCPRLGVEPLHLGEGGHVMVAEIGQPWDAVLLVRQLNPKQFFAWSHDAELRAGFHLSGGSLTDLGSRGSIASGWCMKSPLRENSRCVSTEALRSVVVRTRRATERGIPRWGTRHPSMLCGAAAAVSRTNRATGLHHG
jgi:hypothetical protein